MRDESGENDQAAPEGFNSWNAYWTARGMPWRTEPEISGERQAYLAERRAVKPDSERGIFPFRDENGGISLTRADIEWLLMTHELGRGPVDWVEEKKKPEDRQRLGLDLRGANMRRSNLSGLPLARIQGALVPIEWNTATHDQQEQAAIQLDDANLRGAHLEGGNLRGAYLERVDFTRTNLEHADLSRARMEDAVLIGAYLREALLLAAHLVRRSSSLA